MPENNNTLADRIAINAGIGVVFFLGCAAGLFVLMIAMEMYGDTTTTLEIIKGSGVYYLLVVAILTFIGLFAIGWNRCS